MNKKILIIATMVLMLDQLLKIIIEASLLLNESISIIKNFLAITYTNNYGGAWSILNNQMVLLIIAGLLGLFLIIYYMSTFKENFRNTIAFGLLLGGITGNLLDRLFLGYVRDFIAFTFGNYHFPVFNLSDIAICLGVGLLIYAIIRGEDNGNKCPSRTTKN